MWHYKIKFKRKKTRKEKKVNFYKTMAVSILFSLSSSSQPPPPPQGSEAWVVKKKDATKIQYTEIKLLRSIKDYSRMDKIKNKL
jgi:hypothetical protein